MNTRLVRLPVLLVCLCGLWLWSAGCAKAIKDTSDDATITTRVKTALLNAPDINSVNIGVQTFHGVVTLTGAVQSAAQVQEAVAVARTIHGVRDVKSSLTIKKVPGAVPDYPHSLEGATR
ncbi:MAG TPA: BON domain-containing protein [Vicinamibacterales bacterium]|nr:BON domain-containing protein [Vicinamibacterales bacterium]